MADDHGELRDQVLAAAGERGILPAGETVVAAAVGDLLVGSGMLEARRTTDPDLVGYGAMIGEATHTEGRYVIVATDRHVWDLLTRRHHRHHELDDRPGSSTSVDLAERMAAWYPAEQGEHAGVLELGDRRFLIAHGEGDGAAAIAEAVQRART
jgi:hypothetical protein